MSHTGKESPENRVCMDGPDHNEPALLNHISVGICASEWLPLGLSACAVWLADCFTYSGVSAPVRTGPGMFLSLENYKTYIEPCERE